MFQIVNIYDYLEDEELGEKLFLNEVSEFSCPQDKDVEKFLKELAIEFAKKKQSVTYLIFNEEKDDLVAFFTLTIKPITVDISQFKPSNTTKRKLNRVGEFDNETNTYSLAGFLIAQLAKNKNADTLISGQDILDIISELLSYYQKKVGGLVTFVEAKPKEKLLKFYEDNGFKRFNTKLSNKNDNLVQLLKFI